MSISLKLYSYGGRAQIIIRGIAAWPSGVYQGGLDMKVTKKCKMAIETEQRRGTKLNTCPEKDLYCTSKYFEYD